MNYVQSAISTTEWAQVTPAKGSTHGYRFQFNLGGSNANLFITITPNNTTTNRLFSSHHTGISNRTLNSQYFRSGFDRPLNWPTINVAIIAKQNVSLIKLGVFLGQLLKTRQNAVCVCLYIIFQRNSTFTNWLSWIRSWQWWCVVSMCVFRGNAIHSPDRPKHLSMMKVKSKIEYFEARLHIFASCHPQMTWEVMHFKH